MNDRYILVCSPMRTGSTFVYNFFNECASEYIVKKYERSPMDFIEGTDFAPVIFRHPVACLGSLLEFLDRPFNIKYITKYYYLLRAQFEWANQLLLEFPNCAYELRYENFYNNIDFLVEWSKNNLSISIEDKKLKEFTEKFNFDTIETMSENNLNLFQQNHISSGKGSNQNKIEKIFETKLLYGELSKFSKEYGYDY
tara:strand:- start:693 stop:1283 length:591 start_codon:yes stop_codon:yes gene_type:complete